MHVAQTANLLKLQEEFGWLGGGAPEKEDSKEVAQLLGALEADGLLQAVLPFAVVSSHTQCDGGGVEGGVFGAIH